MSRSSRSRVLLVSPPHTRSTEPPLGIALLAAYLRNLKIEVTCLDLNADAGIELATRASASLLPDTTRIQRAARKIDSALDMLRAQLTYHNRDRYGSAVESYSTLLSTLDQEKLWRITPGDLDISWDFGVETCRRLIDGKEQTPFSSFSITALNRHLDRDPPDLLGISISYRSQFYTALSLAGHIRRAFPAIRVVCGGGFVGCLHSHVVEYLRERIGPVVVGDGEASLRSILALPGDGPTHAIEPDFTDMPLSRYLVPHTVIPFTTGRGCYWGRCSFCAETSRGYAAFDSYVWYDALVRTAERHAPCMIHFTDNALPPAALDLLAKRGSPQPWYGFVRAIPRLDEADFLHRLADGGCRMLQIGLETPVQSLLDTMCKGVSTASYPTILANLREAGIKSYGYMLFGLPGELPHHRDASLKFLVDNPPDFLNASIFRLPPASEIAQDSERFASISLNPRDQSSQYIQFDSEETNHRSLRRWISDHLKAHNSIRPIIRRTPRFYKSSHAVFLSGAIISDESLA